MVHWGALLGRCESGCGFFVHHNAYLKQNLTDFRRKGGKKGKCGYIFPWYTLFFPSCAFRVIIRSYVRTNFKFECNQQKQTMMSDLID